jgi:hypothetical protein
MKNSAILFFMLLFVCAQTCLPQQVTIVVQQRPDYMAPVNQAAHDLTMTLNSLRRERIEQQRVNIERERLTFDEHQASTRGPSETLSYHAVHGNEAEWRINQDEKDAFNGCRALHDDCAKLDGLMRIVSKAIRPDWTQMTMNEYVECLYVIVKNAGFAEQARLTLLTGSKP